MTRGAQEREPEPGFGLRDIIIGYPHTQTVLVGLGKRSNCLFIIQ
jgi:hypothetical protein